jgi:hypothetical protein
MVVLSIAVLVPTARAEGEAEAQPFGPFYWSNVWADPFVMGDPPASSPTTPESATGPSTTPEPTTGPSTTPEPTTTPEPAAALTTAAPVLTVVAGGTVEWAPIGAESSYRVAISNDARGAADRVTSYLWVERVPGEVQSYTPALAPGETAYVGVSANGGVTWSTQEVAVTAPKAEPPPSPAAPVLSVSNGTVHWRPVGSEGVYSVAISNDVRGAADRVTDYMQVTRTTSAVQSYTPKLAVGETVYMGVSADGGVSWSEQEVAVTAPTPEPEPEPVPTTPPAPVLSVSGDTISWKAIPGVTSYTLATTRNPTTAPETTYRVLTGTSVTPPAVPGATVNYGLDARTPVESPWAKEVTISYPAVEPPPPPPPPPPPSGKIIGTNDGAGWGLAAAQTILGGDVTWSRVELGTASNTLLQSLTDGFHTLAIVGNVNDSTPLSQSEPNAWGATVVSQLRANPGMAIAEAGNEMYYKGSVANPVQYGRMYLAAVNAMKAAGIHTPLLFNMWGDYPRTGTWSSVGEWSRDSGGGGWLREAVAGVPGLASAILANGLSTHPYGALGENDDDFNGVNAVAAQESVARAVLGAIPNFYITEFGYSLSNCGQPIGACSESEQASKMRAAYRVFLSDPHVAGIWWYQSHDDGTGRWGFMNDNGTTRPSFTVISEMAAQQGQ